MLDFFFILDVVLGISVAINSFAWQNKFTHIFDIFEKITEYIQLIMTWDFLSKSVIISQAFLSGYTCFPFILGLTLNSSVVFRCFGRVDENVDSPPAPWMWL